MCVVQINNILDKSITITRNCRLDIVQKYEEKNYYAVTSKKVYLVVDSSKNEQLSFNKRLKKIIQLNIDVLIVFDILSSFAFTIFTKSFNSIINFVKNFRSLDIFFSSILSQKVFCNVF